MENKTTSRETELQEILMNAVEVQLAAFKAGIDFWVNWTEHATKFSEESIRRLNEIQSNPAESNRLLLEITDVSRETLRAMTNLPRHTAESFIGELDNFEHARKSSKKARPRPKAKRSVRAKA